jgi:hypothetical protein
LNKGTCAKKTDEISNKFGKGPWVFDSTKGGENATIACEDGLVKRLCREAGTWGDIDYSNCSLVADSVNHAIDNMVCKKVKW